MLTEPKYLGREKVILLKMFFLWGVGDWSQLE